MKRTSNNANFSFFLIAIGLTAILLRVDMPNGVFGALLVLVFFMYGVSVNAALTNLSIDRNQVRFHHAGTTALMLIWLTGLYVIAVFFDANAVYFFTTVLAIFFFIVLASSLSKLVFPSESFEPPQIYTDYFNKNKRKESYTVVEVMQILRADRRKRFTHHQRPKKEKPYIDGHIIAEPRPTRFYFDNDN